ncbi:hypothetical protein PMG71_19115 [Roseofilum sp. BLCC_M154]|uniref:Uncharacterized protein n=1 Tax=Roseofilum acuticapitatum BLCC-M154 TaxID=3022444 RepID=A0ABT7AXG3_9CYAN|nr:hypothetical protein [Roseofilum acuticapitatum]MDJ1171545.1 hypothetical protein [Roseofilum acuticapitatum BLCC-M154]
MNNLFLTRKGLSLSASILLGLLASLMPLRQVFGQTRMAQLRDYCNQGESTYLLAETESFWVSICGGDAPYTYVGVDKQTGDNIRLNLSDYDSSGEYFEARNGNYLYYVIFNTAKGSFLVVEENGKQILQEPIQNWE